MALQELQDSIFRRRVLTGILAVLGLIAASFVPTYLENGAPLLALVAGTGALLNAVTIVAAHRGGPLHALGHAAVATNGTLLVLDNTQTGGFFDPNFSWLYVVPVLAALLVGARAAVAWTALLLVVFVAFWCAPELGLPIRNVIEPEAHAVQSLVNRCATLVMLAGAGVVFVAERDRTHQELVAAVETAEAATSTANRFLATMSHELRTPLNAILGYTELAREQLHADDTDDLDADLERIGRAGRHLLGLVDDVLTLSKLDAGALQIQLEAVDLQEAVTAAVDTLRPDAAQRDVELVVDVGTTDVRADPFRLQQVLLNLLSNAVKFTKDGKVTVDAERAGEQVVLRVRDEGVGIPSNKLETVFERFQQVDGSVTRTYGGTGLGLAICRELLRTMDGTIAVQSAVGEGSTFTVRLRAAE
jgi:signal transduction histidine kinase